MGKLTARDLMTENPFTLSPSDSLTALYDMLDDKRIRHVPVVDDEGLFVGLVTHRDLARHALSATDKVPLSAARGPAPGYEGRTNHARRCRDDRPEHGHQRGGADHARI